MLSRVLFSCSSDSAVLTSSTGSSTENCPGPFSASLGDSTKLTVVVVGVGKHASPKSYCNALLPSGELAITEQVLEIHLEYDHNSNEIPDPS